MVDLNSSAQGAFSWLMPRLSWCCQQSNSSCARASFCGATRFMSSLSNAISWARASASSCCWSGSDVSAGSGSTASPFKRFQALAGVIFGAGGAALLGFGIGIGQIFRGQGAVEIVSGRIAVLELLQRRGASGQRQQNQQKKSVAHGQGQSPTTYGRSPYSTSLNCTACCLPSNS